MPDVPNEPDFGGLLASEAAPVVPQSGTDPMPAFTPGDRRRDAAAAAVVPVAAPAGTSPMAQPSVPDPVVPPAVAAPAATPVVDESPMADNAKLERAAVAAGAIPSEKIPEGGVTLKYNEARGRRYWVDSGGKFVDWADPRRDARDGKRAPGIDQPPVVLRDKKTGKLASFDPETKKFIAWVSL